jgi:hypothetical protein
MKDLLGPYAEVTSRCTEDFSGPGIKSTDEFAQLFYFARKKANFVHP